MRFKIYELTKDSLPSERITKGRSPKKIIELSFDKVIDGFASLEEALEYIKNDEVLSKKTSLTILPFISCLSVIE
jgi:hypothetical protein